VARESSLCRRRVPLIENVGVVIRQLFARPDIANRLDPDSSVVDYRITVGIARMVDEPRVVSPDGSVDHDVIVDRKKKSVMPP
jgi:hypothetical protein